MGNRKQANIPKFGDWGEGSTPYTIVFDKARMKRADPNFNPNDPNQFEHIVEERPPAHKPNTRQPRQMKDGTVERREDRGNPSRMRPQVHGHKEEDAQVPRFGVWNDPNAGGYDFTGEFRRLEKQRNRERENDAATPTHAEQPYYSPYGMGTGRTGYHKSHRHRCVIL